MNALQQFLNGFKKGMGTFGQAIGTIVNFCLLAVIYFVGVGVTSLIAKLSGKKFLQTKIKKEAATYWSDLNLKKKPIEEYYRQF